MVALVDLRKFNVTSFSVKVNCIINNTIKTELERIQGKPLEDGRTLAFGAVYRRGENEFVDIALFDYVKEPEPHLHVTFSYGLENFPRPPRSVPKPNKLLQILDIAQENIDFSCEVSFLYKKGAEKSTIQLPIPIFRTDKAGFHEITGVELSCKEPKGSEYDIRISVDKQGALEHEVTFNFESRARPRIERDFLKRAIRISQQFLKQVEI